jgi:hypothetical protein
MHSENSHRGGPSRARRDRALEGAVLALVVERHPEPLTLGELIEELGEVTRPGGPAAVELAVAALLEAGLLRRGGNALVPTPAALRVAEIELGLP